MRKIREVLRITVHSQCVIRVTKIQKTEIRKNIYKNKIILLTHLTATETEYINEIRSTAKETWYFMRVLEDYYTYHVKYWTTDIPAKNLMKDVNECRLYSLKFQSATFCKTITLKYWKLRFIISLLFVLSLMYLACREKNMFVGLGPQKSTVILRKNRA